MLLSPHYADFVNVTFVHTAVLGLLTMMLACLNGFIRKGTVATGMLALDPYIYDRLTAAALDEPTTRYGLLAKTIELSPDRRWVEFVLRPEARWHDT